MYYVQEAIAFTWNNRILDHLCWYPYAGLNELIYDHIEHALWPYL